MRKEWHKYIVFSAVSALVLMSCNDNKITEGVSRGQDSNVISLSGEIDQVAVTRVNDNGFCDGDIMGVYIVDYNGNTPGTLANNGNRGTNVPHTFDEAAYKWNSAYDVYWKDDRTHIDIYGYYPYASPTDVNAYAFEVQKDQTKNNGDEMGSYEASDFLWGKAADVAPTEKIIRLPLRHKMSNARITLKEGEGFAEGAWIELEKQVLVLNTKRSSVIDLATGNVTATGEVAKTGTIPFRKDNEFRAIVVPQTVEAGKVLFSITVDGMPYTFKKEEAFTYIAGKMHNFTIQVNKKEASGQYEFKLIDESITAWENDMASHEATAKEYIVIHVEEVGTLKECIMAANKDYTQLQNLKITGEINAEDFYFMRDEMSRLQSLNLKEVKIKGDTYEYHKENEIPSDAMSGKKTLMHLVLPEKLTKIGNGAFESSSLIGSLYIPEGVKEIGSSAFYLCKSLTGSLHLPSTLESIGAQTFGECSFTCELILPSNLKSIGERAFFSCSNLYGELHLPDKLSYLGSHAFYNCISLSGSITIPQTITEIKESAFAYCHGLNGTLNLHDGITSIESFAFTQCPFKGELILPKNLVIIGEYAFETCNFSGKLKLPSKLEVINNGAFLYNQRISGILEIPNNVISIGSSAFYYCKSLEGIIFPKSIENIGSSAFENCFGIGSIVCQSTIPPYMFTSAFNGVAKDNFTVEVPESAVADYQTAVGWNEFKRIGAHHELICRPALANALNTHCTRNLILNAEGDWEVESIPDWCSLSSTSGSKKTELTLTIDEMPKGTTEGRNGEIIFRLKDKDYTTKCSVSQYDYKYSEDEIITLQKATKGKNGGINLVFLGDGYNAKDIAKGDYMETIQKQIEHFFAIEPYTTYRDYFNVHTAIPVSLESGIGTVNTIRYTKFETTFTGGVGLKCNHEAVFNYALQIPAVTKENLNQTLLIMIPNSTDYGGICEMWSDGSALAFCPMSTDDYPYDARGLIQHEAGGHGFGKLGDEYIYHNAFIDFCPCSCCEHTSALNSAKSNGWYDNLSLTGKMHEVPWSHLIFDERYSDRVDIYEGGFMHSRGVFRSEQTSCMNNNIPYHSAISRESIVKRIKKYAGEEYSFEEFVKNDKGDTGAITRAMNVPYAGSRVHTFQYPPKIHKGSPLK
ncbi:leucine-rich repeat protein [Bacteroides caecimuris]|uniref:leucine-rich repeat protein n=1 Tax=Bacteroides caecimuris TaxID=1796613 RepID=UPI00242C250C|nr:leucine-rich repeat protein [Bacteroides caecimuris]